MTMPPQAAGGGVSFWLDPLLSGHLSVEMISLLPGFSLLADGALLSRRSIVAVSATRVKVVAIERFARQRRSTLTRFAATAGWRLWERGAGWLRSEPFRASPEKLILSAWRPMPATAPER
ncbi:hypothetical protein GCM10028793_45610 [Nocardiopsis oceani]